MGHKIPRLQQVIHFKVAQLIQRDLADPRIGLLTVTRVELAKDLGHCTVWWSVLGDDSARSKAEHALDDARGWIQREVAGALRTRKTPHLEFAYDESIEGSVRISQKLRDVLGPTGGSVAESDGDDEAGFHPDGDDEDAGREER